MKIFLFSLVNILFLFLHIKEMFIQGAQHKCESWWQISEVMSSHHRFKSLTSDDQTWEASAFTHWAIYLTGHLKKIEL